MSFFEELRRRNVFRVGIAYAVAAWIILQLLDVLGDILELPPWAGKLILVILIIGFVLALILAWAFELTPEGVKREKDVNREQSVTRSTGRKLDFIIIGLLALALGYFIWESRFMDPVGDASNGNQATAGSTAGVSEPADQPVPTASTATPADDEAQPSGIVVLPFVNMSADPEQEYFSDGLSEEILNALAQIRDLRVISRTSAFAFKDKDLSIPEIADQLNVSHVLEGSVRTAGGDVRITAQLIEVDSDSHLWSQAYSRQLENVFEIQEEISEAIAEQLQLRLVEGGASDRPTENVEAYQAFLRGRHHYQARGDENAAIAEKQLRRAVTLDPEFDDAWANLAATLVLLAFYSENEHIALYRQSKESADRALSINPRNGLAHAVLGLLATGDLDYERALKQYDLAIEYSPNESNSYLWKGMALQSLGYIRDALDVLKTAERFDPAFTNLQNKIITTYLTLGDLQAARSHYNQLLALEPDYILDEYVEMALLSGSLSYDDPIFQEVLEGQPEALALSRDLLAALENPERREAVVEKVKDLRSTNWRSPRFVMLFALGAVEPALDAWREIYLPDRKLRGANALSGIWLQSNRESLSDPALMHFFREIGLVDYWREHGDPDFCRVTEEAVECGAP